MSVAEGGSSSPAHVIVGIKEGPRRSISDQPTATDSIGFKPYVQALAEFLTNPETEPPLTVSIEGEWGSGKSSFMMQLQEELKRLTRGGIVDSIVEWLFFGKPTRIVCFNAWRHDKLDSLYSGFAIQFLEDIRKGTPFLKRIIGHLSLWRKRFDWKDGGVLSVARICALWLFFFFAICMIATRGVPALYDTLTALEHKQSVEGQSATKPESTGTGGSSGREIKFLTGPVASLVDYVRQSSLWEKASGVASWTGYSLIVLLLLERITKISDPISVDAKKRILAPEYEKRVGFVVRFHKDLSKIVAAYLGDPKRALWRRERRRIFVFIDDLDRCEIPKAADLMQGLNLMISDSPQIVFILGIDRQKIAAALAVKYQKFLPYFSPPLRSPGQTEGKFENNGVAEFDPIPGLEFGYSFLEKFLQIGFQVPTMTDEELKKFLSALDTELGSTSSEKAEASPSVTPEEVSGDTDEIMEIVRMVSPSLGFNPRRLKQFLNIFRLQRFIAYHTKRLRMGESGAGATLEQLGKFVAVLLRWPGILPDLAMTPELLVELEKCVKDSSYSPTSGDGLKKNFRYWSARSSLMDLLKVGLELPSKELVRHSPEWFENRKIDAANWGLAAFDVKAFLNVSPTVIPIVPLSKKTARIRSRGSRDSKATSDEEFIEPEPEHGWENETELRQEEVSYQPSEFPPGSERPPTVE